MTSPNPNIVDYEDEVTIYAKVGDFKGFREANRVINIHELSTFIEGKGKYRVRKNTDESGTSFVATIKGQTEGNVVKTNVDHPAVVNAGYFEAARILADGLTIRDRFIFNGSVATIKKGDKEVQIPPIDFEVDVYTRHDGRESEWVKIDVEVGKILEAIKSLGMGDGDNPLMDLTITVSDLPFKPQAAFISSSDNTPEELEVIRKLWDEFTQDPYGGEKKPIESSIRQQKETNEPVNPPSGKQPSEGKDDGEAGNV